MSRGNILSIRGLYLYNDKLFENMKFPDNFPTDQKEVTIFNIVAECAELECLYPDWDFMHSMIEIWSKLEYPVWNRIYKASLLEYNPIENYNRVEKETITDTHSDTHSGNDITSNTGNDVSNVTGSHSSTNTETHSGKDTNLNSNTAYDANVLYPHDQAELTHGETIGQSVLGSNGETNTFTHGKVETIAHGEKISYDGKIIRDNNTAGNIGVTTSQQMLEQEIEIAAKLNLSKIITESFKYRFCILIY